ncbi:hypothetical protein BXZ70DRAFT_544376 [Cristinia sonorae]|uniref:DUF6533 domain-containing protein n=1 Tax=Cristinia sonorae TaxID=1940300 RepID=A0A8K0UG42_9AGAR|nr:hypothetical protein BXZ70DRAFT_544376 [Cristinia sonorae]
MRRERCVWRWSNRKCLASVWSVSAHRLPSQPPQYHGYLLRDSCLEYVLTHLTVQILGSLRLHAAFLVYDHILTFPGELKLVWGRRFTGATALFLLLRYLTLFSKVSLLVTAVSWPGQTNRVSPLLVQCPH